MKTVAVLIWFILVFAILSGCVSIKYDATTGSFAYNRFGSQELQGLHVTKSVDGTTVDLGSQESKAEIAEQLTEILKTVRKIAEKFL